MDYLLDQTLEKLRKNGNVSAVADFREYIRALLSEYISQLERATPETFQRVQGAVSALRIVYENTDPSRKPVVLNDKDGGYTR